MNARKLQLLLALCLGLLAVVGVSTVLGSLSGEPVSAAAHSLTSRSAEDSFMTLQLAEVTLSRAEVVGTLETNDARGVYVAGDITGTYTITVYLPVVAKRWPPLPYAPALYAIYNNDGDGSYTISWTEQPERLAETYTLQEAANAGFTADVRQVCSTAQQSCVASGKLAGTYYYRVRGHNTWGYGAWSNTRAATVVLPATPTVTDTLMALYHSTDGANWRDNTGWGSSDPYCTWNGVTCAVGEVVQLDLHVNNLSGTIPPELGNLSSLQGLDLEWNDLGGTIPSQLGNLSGLGELNLYHNNLSGTIPPELGNLGRLRDLNLSSNSLSGTIPSELGNLSSLEHLGLFSNNLSGTIPPELGSLSSLESLGLGYDNLSGTIPPELGNLSSLKYLSLSYSNLSGTIPPELGNLSSLQMLYLENNNLSNPIPAELANLSDLRYLHLNDNPNLTCWETAAARDWAVNLCSFNSPCGNDGPPPCEYAGPVAVCALVHPARDPVTK